MKRKRDYLDESPVQVSELRVGDLVDLEGDPYADPRRDPMNCFEFELAEVASVERETADCVAVGFEGFDVVGFPPHHIVTARRYIGEPIL
jgi:hypothetical protein